MLYKAFAAITLVSAPIIVMLVQGITPHPSATPSAPVVQPMVPQPPVEQPLPSQQSFVAPMPVEQAPPAVSFGQPMPEAGKPFLTPGNGLPGEPPPGASEAGSSDTATSSEARPF
ncbi:hypothetical protein [Sphingobium sp. Cam5-1]|uniref:hypothetical protein n=1 Tax=Sphingobium sp. Cam5-1 TaxID=2789327 RepID=UPI0018AD25E2|nr:hypothetical protein [Sphingobium sp. Cam5-1]QPI71833.1 hypothetical protein IZV00_07740 [Sphingobium sp. Cam5-1]